MANLDVNPGLQRSVLFDRIYLLHTSNCKFSDVDIKRLQKKYMQFNFIFANETQFILLEYLQHIHPIQ